MKKLLFSLLFVALSVTTFAQRWTSISNNAQINVSDLNNGVYFVRLNGANGTTTQKFIKK